MLSRSQSEANNREWPWMTLVWRVRSEPGWAEWFYVTLKDVACQVWTQVRWMTLYDLEWPWCGMSGLSQGEACKLSNYLHMHPPNQLFKKTLLQRANLDRAIDFLDPATEDIPGAPNLCWSIQHERGGSQVVIRSLLWPGYTFFHIPGSRHFGSLYNGCGIYNIDLPFMMNWRPFGPRRVLRGPSIVWILEFPVFLLSVRCRNSKALIEMHEI